MKVFHGTNGNIDEICLTRGSRYKDFGQGFYVTPDIETARRMAKKKANLFGGKPTVITYELDESALISGTLNVLAFPEKPLLHGFGLLMLIGTEEGSIIHTNMISSRDL